MNSQVAATDVVQGLVVVHDCYVRVLQQRVHGQHGVVGLDHCGRDLRACPDREAQLRFLAVVHGEALQHQAAEAGAGATADSVEDHAALQARAIVGKLADPVKNEVYDFLTDCVVPTGEVVGGFLLSADQLLGVQELPVRAGAHLVDDRRLEVNEDGTGHMLACSCF